MSQRITPLELRALRNDIPIRDVVFALGISWKRDDELFRFCCPKCRGWNTSLHPTENLGRCFDCSTNFNPIDLVQGVKNVGFRNAVSWLRALKNLMRTDNYGAVVARMGRNAMAK